MVAELDPSGQRPVFVLASAAGMERHKRASAAMKKFPCNISIWLRRRDLRREITDVDSELLQRAGELLRRVRAVCQLTRPNDQVLNARSAEVRFKDPLWIVKIAHNQIKTAEVLRQFPRQLCISRKETGERAIFDGTNCIGVAGCLGQRGDVFVAENFQISA